MSKLSADAELGPIGTTCKEIFSSRVRHARMVVGASSIVPQPLVRRPTVSAPRSGAHPMPAAQLSRWRWRADWTKAIAGSLQSRSPANIGIETA